MDFMLEDICGVDLFSSIIEVLKHDLFNTEGMYGPVFELVQQLYIVVQGVATLLIFIYFMMAFVDKLSSEHFTFDQMVRQFVLLFVSKFLIDHGMEIITLIYDIGIVLVYEISDPSAINGASILTSAAAMLEDFKSSMGLTGIMGVLKDAWVTVLLIIPWSLSWILGLVVKIIMYGRMIEIYLRAVFTPIALADFYQGGLQSAGFRWLRNLLAVSIQGGVMLIIIAIYSRLVVVFVQNAPFSVEGFFDFVGVYLALLASGVMLLFKSLSISREIVGTA